MLVSDVRMKVSWRARMMDVAKVCKADSTLVVRKGVKLGLK